MCQALTRSDLDSLFELRFMLLMSLSEEAYKSYLRNNLIFDL